MKIYNILLILVLLSISNSQVLKGRGRGRALRGRALADQVSVDFSGLGLTNSTGESGNHAGNSSNSSTTKASATSSSSTGINIPIVINNNINNNNNGFTGNTGNTGAGEWTPIDIDSAKTDSVFLANFDYALTYVIALGIQSTLLKDEAYTISEVYDIWQQEDDGINYKVECGLTSDKSGVNVNISLTTYYQASSNSRGILEFYYQYLYVTDANILNDVQVNWTNQTDMYTISVNPIADLSNSTTGGSPLTPQTYEFNLTQYLALGGYNEIAVDQINTSELLNSYLMFGAQYISQEGVANGYLSSTGSYSITQVLSLYGQQNSEGNVWYFRFEILIENGMGGSALVNFEILFVTGNEGPSVPTYGFNYAYN